MLFPTADPHLDGWDDEDDDLFEIEEELHHDL